jgi:hypothetical protein
MVATMADYSVEHSAERSAQMKGTPSADKSVVTTAVQWAAMMVAK